MEQISRMKTLDHNRLSRLHVITIVTIGQFMSCCFYLPTYFYQRVFGENVHVLIVYMYVFVHVHRRTYDMFRSAECRFHPALSAEVTQVDCYHHMTLVEGYERKREEKKISTTSDGWSSIERRRRTTLSLVVAKQDMWHTMPRLSALASTRLLIRVFLTIFPSVQITR